MKFLKFAVLLVVILMSSCASSYKTINTKNLNYRSKSTDNNVTLEYKYELLSKKYKKKEISKGVRLVAVKVINKSNKDLVFGSDIKLIYDDNTSPYIMETDNIYSALKQKPATYLWYLLLAPLQFTTTTTTNNITTTQNSFPAGLIIGPGLAVGNITVASSANKKFKRNLEERNLNGLTIKSGETVTGLVGLKSYDYNAISIKVE